MNSLLEESAFLGVVVTLATYLLGSAIRRRIRHALVNPLLFSVVATILVLLVGRIPYSAYQSSASVLSWLLTPATVCLAIPLYEQLSLLKRNCRAILAGIAAGVLTSLATILALSWLFRLDHAQYATLLPKSITTAIGIGVSQEHGGCVALTVPVIIITGILGNIFAESACRILRIREPIARGVAIGSSSHAIGTAKALEIGQVEGAISSLSLVLSGLLTVLIAIVAAKCL